MEAIQHKDSITPSLFKDWHKTEELRIGEINFDPTTSYILKTFYQKDISQYLCHKEAVLQIPLKATVYAMAMDDCLILCKNYNGIDDIMLLRENDIKIQTVDYQLIFSINLDFSDKKNTLRIQVIKNNDFIDFDLISINFKLQRDVLLIYHFIQRQCKRIWQKFFETKLPIPSPHYYQSHFFLKKLNSRGKEQKRVIVMTDKFIFNVEYDINGVQYALSEVKWAHAIQSFTSLKINPKSKTPYTLKVMIDTSTNKKIVNLNKFLLKNKDSCELIFYNEDSFNEFIFQCRRLFNIITVKELEVINK